MNNKNLLATAAPIFHPPRRCSICAPPPPTEESREREAKENILRKPALARDMLYHREIPGQQTRNKYIKMHSAMYDCAHSHATYLRRDSLRENYLVAISDDARAICLFK